MISIVLHSSLIELYNNDMHYTYTCKQYLHIRKYRLFNLIEISILHEFNFNLESNSNLEFYSNFDLSFSFQLE